MKKSYGLLLLSLLLTAGCDSNPEASVHVDGKIDVTVREDKQEPPKIQKDTGGTIVGDGKKFDSKDF
ncbi:MAG: hypothetical protein C0631_15550 [Sedimenticola sp.]|nr:MAG: hypothetical protein C0631_15550 [Sedimenticola sp.]